MTVGRKAHWEELRHIEVLKLCEDVLLADLRDPACPKEIKRNIALTLYKGSIPKDITAIVRPGDGWESIIGQYNELKNGQKQDSGNRGGLPEEPKEVS